VHFLTTTKVKPDEFDRRIGRYGQPTIAKGALEKRRGPFDFSGWQCQVAKAHGRLIVYS
jgi:hypothetical protein